MLTLTYIGQWDPKTNTPYLVDGVGTNGDTYSIYITGTQDLGHGSILYVQNQSLVYNSGIWCQLPITYTLDGGGGSSGSGITALTGDVTATGPGSAVATISDITVTGKILTGYVSGAGTITASDSILTAIQKLNGNIAALVTGVSSVSGTPNRITSTGGSTPVIDISATFEALLGKVATGLGQFASTTSAQLATVISDETGSGSLMFGTDPSLTISAPGTTTVGYLGIPQNSQSANYTCVMSDSGKHLYHPGADTTPRTWTIPANSSVAYPIGTTLTFINDTSAGVITIAITTDTMILAGAGTTGSRTLAANGIATAVKMTSTRWIINGTGLT